MDEIARQYHDVANIFPLMSGEEFEALKADIAQHGLREPIWLHPDGSIVDGRNRHRACIETGTPPIFREWDGNGSLVAFVVSMNLVRRHLDESQRAMVAAKLANMGKGRPGENRSIDPFSQPMAAELLNVSVPSVKRAKQVQEQGAPELAALVEAGEVAVSTAADVATLPLEEQQEIIAKGEKEILAAAKVIRERRTKKTREKRIKRINEIAQNNTPLDDLDCLYPVIYADPPWRYEHAQSATREIENHYPTMSLDEICALPVGDLATDPAILFLWATSPKLAEAMQVIEAWGFTYRSCMVWDKERIGMGYYARQQHELLLIAARGEMPVPEDGNRPASVQRIKRNENHSEKPCEFRQIIERMYPELPRIELFARQAIDGWARWGNQA